MQDVTKYAVGLDVGTTKVRCVVSHIDGGAVAPTIVGVSEEPNTGMRKGTVVNLVAVAQAIDKALESAERMSGYQVNRAAISINGAHIKGLGSRGVVAVGVGSHEIGDDDIARAEEAATVLQLPANREILEVTPRSYQLDGQENIKDPLGMTGVRLEVDAHVITALGPHLKNLIKACEMTETVPSATVLAGLGAARAVLTEQQMENGVVLIDIGGSTTNVIVFEEGDLQHVAVIPVGSINITNDLAIGLKTDLDVAELVKIQHAVASGRVSGETTATIKTDDQQYEFETSDIDMIVDARLEELFELIVMELKTAGKHAKLPGGAVITGGGAHLKGIDDYARQALQLSARVAAPSGLSGVTEKVTTPEFATAVGLMFIDLSASGASGGARGGAPADKRAEQALGAVKGLGGKISMLLGRFKS